MTTPRTGTAAQDRAGRRDAARALLQQPVLTAAHDPETFELVRRHAASLKAMFAEQLGYRLVVDSSFVRLVKTPPARTAPPRPARRANGDDFGATTYTCLALTCAALLAPGTGHSVPVSALLEQVRVDAAEQRIELGDSVSERRHMVSALQVLLEWGVLVESGGAFDDAGHMRDEAVLEVNRALLPHLLRGPLHAATGPAAVLAGASHDTPARRLYRRLVEDPFVAREDLDHEMLDVLVRERHDLTRRLDEDFGLVLEVRTEGALAYDPDGALTDDSFPGSGTLEQACLLLVSELTDRCMPEAGSPLHVAGPTVDAVLGELVATYARTWRGEYVRDIALLRRDIVARLVRVGLARPHEDGLVLAAPVARYRPALAEGTSR